MLKIGEFNNMKINSISSSSVGLATSGEDIELPLNELPKDAKEGDTLSVFLYNINEDTLKATTKKPEAMVNQFAYLGVTGVTKTGAFLHWGLKKDLYLPESRMPRELEIGDKVLVHITLDEDHTGLIADGFWENYIHDDPEQRFHEGDAVSLLCLETSELGTKVIVENQYLGLVYRSEVYKRPAWGQPMKGYILKIREDGKIDVSFKKKGWNSVVDSQEQVMEALNQAGGFLPLHDKSDPELILEQLNMSKKIFKKSIGNLYKQGKITLTENGICLKD